MGKRILIAAIVLMAIVIAAGGIFFNPFSPKNYIKVDDSGSTQQGIQEVVNANNQFALELYSKLDKSEQQNIFYSPYSISSALAMTYEGAGGKTAEEMKSVFHFPESNILRPNFAAIYKEINKGDKEYELKTGNALWVQKNYPFLGEYTDTVEKYYGGKATNLDFINNAEESRQIINSFINDQTNDKIKDIIPQGALNDGTRLVLTNAIYFKGTWEWEFDKSDTREQDFKISPTEIVKTQMMYMDPEKAIINYTELEDLQILELPYKGEDISMLILLPKENLSLIESQLTAEKIKEYKSQMKETTLDAIYLPKFEFNSKYFMVDTLKELGMPTAFNPDEADFTGMTGNKDLYITEVIHQAYVKVDEKGTEAAAATAVVTGITSVAPQNIFRADHPFIFIIQERKTGNILFIGRVVDPRSQ